VPRLKCRVQLQLDSTLRPAYNYGRLVITAHARRVCFFCIAMQLLCCSYRVFLPFLRRIKVVQNVEN